MTSCGPMLGPRRSGLSSTLRHIFHARYECGVGVRWDDPLLLPVRFENAFFGVRVLGLDPRIVLSLARSTMFSSTTAWSSSCSVHRAQLLGGSEQAKAISLASAAPSKMRGLAEAGEYLRATADDDEHYVYAIALP